MNCSKCRTLAEIEKAVAACETCANRSGGCVSHCKTFAELRDRCLRCNPESDAGTPHGRVRVIENAIGGDFKIEPDFIFGRHPDRSTPLTPLTEEAEDAALRVVLAFADLAIWELPIVWCLLNHVKGDRAAEVLGLNSRQTLQARVMRLLADHPWTQALYRGYRHGIKTTTTVSRRRVGTPDRPSDPDPIREGEDHLSTNERPW